jgi:cytochrome c oxidase assembly protein subunit 11
MDRANRRVLIKSTLGVVVMFLFALFVMPPLYDAFCELTGLGGKTGGAYVAQDAGIDESRTVKVQFVTTNNGSMPWDFAPDQFDVQVHPGAPTPVTFYAKNTTGEDMVAQAIPSIAPANAAQYFHKTQCFCFSRQPLAAGESAHMPVVFIVDRDLPAAVNTITLSYTLFDVTNLEQQAVASVKP